MEKPYHEWTTNEVDNAVKDILRRCSTIRYEPEAHEKIIRLINEELGYFQDKRTWRHRPQLQILIQRTNLKSKITYRFVVSMNSPEGKRIIITHTST